MPLKYQKCYTYEKLAVLCNLMQARPLHRLPLEIFAVLFTFSKTGKTNCSSFVNSVVKVYFYRTHGLGHCLVFKRNYEPVSKNHCPSILSCCLKEGNLLKCQHQLVKQNTLFTKHLPVAVS